MKYDLLNKDINMMTDEEIMKIIMGNQIIQMAI